MKYNSDKTGYSKTRSVWNFIADPTEYKTVGWAQRRAQTLANQTGKAHCVAWVNGVYRIVIDNPNLKPQHRTFKVNPETE